MIDFYLNLAEADSFRINYLTAKAGGNLSKPTLGTNYYSLLNDAKSSEFTHQRSQIFHRFVV